MISCDNKYLKYIVDISDKKDIIDNSPFKKFYVYLLDEEIVSFLIYDDIYDRIEITYIYTVDKYRGKGYAYKLIEYLINNYKTYSNITLEVNEKNIKAINLYKKIGFKCISIRKNYYNGDDGILMYLNIGGNNGRR